LKGRGAIDFQGEKHGNKWFENIFVYLFTLMFAIENDIVNM
jgi:hypothetical protein